MNAIQKAKSATRGKRRKAPITSSQGETVQMPTQAAPPSPAVAGAAAAAPGVKAAELPAKPKSSAKIDAAAKAPHYDEEDAEDYGPGGYHVVGEGDRFKDGRYVIVRKLGWGHFSTVWLAKDTVVSRHVALKIVRSAAQYRETALDEIKLLKRVSTANPQHPGVHHVVQLLDYFEHRGPNGMHVCMVFEVLGENLLSLIRKYHHLGIPVPLVQQISKQVLLALDYLHRECSIIHTDLKPENVLICIDDVELVANSISCTPTKGNSKERRPPLISGSQPLRSSPNIQQLAKDIEKQREDREDSIEPLANSVDNVTLDRPNTPADDAANDAKAESLAERITVKIADLGNACWTFQHFTNDVQTRQYRAPEVMVGSSWGASIDCWSASCMIFELLTGDYLFDPQAGTKYTKDDDHVAQIIELLADFPPFLVYSGKRSAELFNRKGELRRIQKLKRWSLPDVLHQKYRLSRADAERLSSFLLPMLQIDPSARANSGGMSQHEWLRGTPYMHDVNVNVEVGSTSDGIRGWVSECRKR